MREVTDQSREPIFGAELLDLRAIHFERALPQPDQIIRADRQDVLDVFRIIHVRRFHIEANDVLVFRGLQHDQKREILQRLRVTKGQILIETLTVLGVQVNVKKFACFEAQLDVPHVIETRNAAVRGLGVHAKKMLNIRIKAADQVERFAHVREVHVAARFVGFGSRPKRIPSPYFSFA